MEHQETRKVVRCPECYVPISLSGDEEYKMTSHMLWYHPTDEDIVDGVDLCRRLSLNLDSIMHDKNYRLASYAAGILSDAALRVKKYADLKLAEEYYDEIQEETD